MSSIDRIEKLTGQYEKEMELAEKHRNRGKEHMELAEKHTKKAGDLEKQIKYEKGGEVFDRVNALNLTPEELQLILQLLDDRTQLMDAVRKLYPERIQNNGGNTADAGNDPDKGEDPETRVPEQDRDSDKPFSPYSDPGESPAYGENGADGEDEEFPVYGEDDDEDDGTRRNISMIHEAKKTVVTLTVAECGEFHDLGEYHEGITGAGEAVTIFNRIPPERMNGIPSIGINIHTEGTERYEDTQMDIISGRTADLEVLDYVPDITDNPEALEVIAELIGRFPGIEVRGSLEKWQKPEGEKEKQTGRPSIREKLEGKKAVIGQRDKSEKEIPEKGKGEKTLKDYKYNRW